jgi:hypothetical protein
MRHFVMRIIKEMYLHGVYCQLEKKLPILFCPYYAEMEIHLLPKNCMFKKKKNVDRLGPIDHYSTISILLNPLISHCTLPLNISLPLSLYFEGMNLLYL